MSRILVCSLKFLPFPFLKTAVMFASFQAFGTLPESTDASKISCIIGVRWEAYLFRNQLQDMVFFIVRTDKYNYHPLILYLHDVAAVGIVR